LTLVAFVQKGQRLVVEMLKSAIAAKNSALGLLEPDLLFDGLLEFDRFSARNALQILELSQLQVALLVDGFLEVNQPRAALAFGLVKLLLQAAAIQISVQPAVHNTKYRNNTQNKIKSLPFSRYIHVSKLEQN